MKKQIACVVSDADYQSLAELAEVEESSVSRIMRRGLKRELQEHDSLLITGKPRSASRKRKRQRRAAATA